MWQSCKERIEQLQKIDPDMPATNEISVIMGIYNTEEEFNKFLISENALIKLLSFVSAICILICVFGFVSLVSLTCEERRKSIAIRKVNGATAGDILAMFAKEYFLLLIIGAVIAFTTGYFIMQRWLVHYVKQTSIPVWIYLAIICVLALVIVFCVGWQVYKSSIENPADVVKSE
jgi:ABC-type antimicrobial peptide transport system permease subunit